MPRWRCDVNPMSPPPLNVQGQPRLCMSSRSKIFPLHHFTFTARLTTPLLLFFFFRFRSRVDLWWWQQAAVVAFSKA